MNSVKYLLFYMELFCDMFGSVLECYELIQKHPCSCSPIVNFLKFTFYHGMVTSVIFLIKKIK